MTFRQPHDDFCDIFQIIFSDGFERLAAPRHTKASLTRLVCETLLDIICPYDNTSLKRPKVRESDMVCLQDEYNDCSPYLALVACLYTTKAATVNMRFLLLLISCLSFLGLANVLPVRMQEDVLISTTNTTHFLGARSCVAAVPPAQVWFCDYLIPNMDEIRWHMTDPAAGGRVADYTAGVFYTRWADLGNAHNLADFMLRVEYWLAANCLSGFAVWNAWDAVWTLAQTRWIVDHEEQMDVPNAFVEWNVCQYQSLATTTRNRDAFLFFADDWDWLPESVWAEYEYWALTWNPYVERIWRVDFTGGNYDKRLLWVKTRTPGTESVATGKLPMNKVCVKWPERGLTNGVPDPAKWP
jgi:hypothetical protein